MTFTLVNPSENILKTTPIRSKWLVVNGIVVMVMTMIFFVVHLALVDGLSAMVRVPWWSWVLLWCGVLPLLAIHFAATACQKRWFMRYQMLLKLVFETKLGMFSPKAAINISDLHKSDDENENENEKQVDESQIKKNESLEQEKEKEKEKEEEKETEEEETDDAGQIVEVSQEEEEKEEKEESEMETRSPILTKEKKSSNV